MRNIRTILCAAMLLCAAGAWGQWVEWEAMDATLFDTYKAKAEAGDAAAQYYLGKYYSESKMGEGGQKTALKWWKKAAKQGYKQAQDALEKYRG